ncbi:MAG: hypothetical protein KGZ58_10180, partial [Ignavibacteriales bacterium]|nr:hypothetical protein [Ignavibacteriales bacterium]
EIETTVDFVYWESDIENCPFLEPITEEEIELYISYVLSNDFQEELHWLSNWQDYTEYKNNYTRDDDETIIIPEWYMFYDGRKGTSGLMSLPDVRGEKEKVYIDLVRNKSRIEREKKAAETPPSKPDTRPYISFADMRIIEDFIKQFEEPKLLKYFRVVERNLTSEKEEEVEQAFEFLKRVPDLVEIESNDDWRDGIIKAAKKCQRTFLANELENAFREYRNRIDIGIPFEPHLDKQYRDSMKELAKSHKQNLIEGRILNGEPGDLDF